MKDKFEKAQKLRDNGQIEEALILYSEVRADALQKKDQELASECLHMIGVSYYQIKKFEEAEKYLKESLGEFEVLTNLEYAGFVLRDLGMVAKSQKNFGLAKDYLNKSIVYLQKAGNKGHEGMSYVKLGRIFAEEEKFDEAIKEIDKGIKLLGKSKEKFFLSSAYLDRAKVDTQMSLNILNSFAKKDEFKKRREEIGKILS